VGIEKDVRMFRPETFSMLEDLDMNRRRTWLQREDGLKKVVRFVAGVRDSPFIDDGDVAVCSYGHPYGDLVFLSKALQLRNNGSRLMVKMKTIQYYQRRVKIGLFLKVLETLFQLFHAEGLMEVGKDKTPPFKATLQRRKFFLR